MFENRRFQMCEQISTCSIILEGVECLFSTNVNFLLCNIPSRIYKYLSQYISSKRSKKRIFGGVTEKLFETFDGIDLYTLEQTFLGHLIYMYTYVHIYALSNLKVNGLSDLLVFL